MGQGSPELIQVMGHKGPSIKPRCIGTISARTQRTSISQLPLHKIVLVITSLKLDVIFFKVFKITEIHSFTLADCWGKL
jgi:hypothetical protein